MIPNWLYFYSGARKSDSESDVPRKVSKCEADKLLSPNKKLEKKKSSLFFLIIKNDWNVCDWPILTT